MADKSPVSGSARISHLTLAPPWVEPQNASEEPERPATVDGHRLSWEARLESLVFIHYHLLQLPIAKLTYEQFIDLEAELLQVVDSLRLKLERVGA